MGPTRLDNSAAAIARYTHSKKTDEPLAELRAGVIDFYESDAIGSITSLTNASGTVVKTGTFDPFGNPTASTGTLVNPFQYAGRESDLETGTYYYRARSYDPTVGRFISEDPLRYFSSLNFYPYVSNNPVRFNDPLGLSEQDASRILDGCKICTNYLTAIGERRAGSGLANGRWNNIIDWFTLGYVYSGCDRQANLTAICLDSPFPGPYNDHWDFTVESRELGFHRVTVARSRNPSDPIIVCDPWLDSSAAFPAGPGGAAGGGGGGRAF